MLKVSSAQCMSNSNLFAVAFFVGVAGFKLATWQPKKEADRLVEVGTKRLHDKDAPDKPCLARAPQGALIEPLRPLIVGLGFRVRGFAVYLKVVAGSCSFSFVTLPQN